MDASGEVICDMLRFLFHGTSVHITVSTRDELTEDDKEWVIQEHHENPLGGHQAISRTHSKISQLYQWKGMRAQIREYIKNVQSAESIRLRIRLSGSPWL